MSASLFTHFVILQPYSKIESICFLNSTVSPILLCWTSQAPSGRMGSVGGQPFSDLSRDVPSGSSLGSGWATQGYSQCCPEATPLLSCVLGVVVLLEAFNLRSSLRSRALWRLFIKEVSVHCWLRYIGSFIFSSILTSLPVPAADKHPHSMMLPLSCFTVGMVLARWWAGDHWVLGHLPDFGPSAPIAQFGQEANS